MALETWKAWCIDWDLYPLPQVIFRSVSSRIRPSAFQYKIYWKKGNETLYVDFGSPPIKVMVDKVVYDISLQTTHNIQTLEAEEAARLL